MEKHPSQRLRASPEDFVRVQGNGFVLGAGDTPFKFIGCNSYVLLKNACREQSLDVVDNVMDMAMYAGITVMRIWAFCDGDSSYSLQKEPGILYEPNCEWLDYIVMAAGERGIKLIMVLTNYWEGFGGLQQYVKWSTDATEPKSEDFYGDSLAKWYFRKYTRALIGHVNTITGVPYSEEPAIFAWSIINEPRCKGDTNCTILKEFLGGMARLIKKLDSNHLVTFGSEGFFGSSTDDYLKYNPYNTSGEGVDFCSDADIPEVDFACAHLWLDSWGVDEDLQVRAAFIEDWITSHSDAAQNILNKPVVLSSFAVKNNKLDIYREVFENVTGSETMAPTIPGALFWHLATSGYANWDPYVICYSDELRDRLKALGSPVSSSEKLAVEAKSIKPGLQEIEMVTETADESESWEIMKLCWEFAGKLAPKPQVKAALAVTYSHTAQSYHRRCCGFMSFFKFLARKFINYGS